MKDVQCYELFRGIALKKSRIFIFLKDVEKARIIVEDEIYSSAYMECSIFLH